MESTITEWQLVEEEEGEDEQFCHFATSPLLPFFAKSWDSLFLNKV